MARLHCFGWSSIFLGMLSIAFLSGCGANNVAGPAAGRTIPSTKQGKVHGGQQPVSGATLQLYTVGTTGDGSAATALLTQPVTSDANGDFTIGGDYTCPSSAALVYIVATGGNPGLAAGTNNADLAMMASLGPCGSLTASTFIFINEVTTVAAVWSLAPYMSSYSAIGSGTGDAAGLTQVFTQASELANTTPGTAPGTNVPAGVTVPVAYLNTLANVLAACVNTTGGVAGDGSVCGTLLSAATANGTAPMNLIDATMNIVNNPTSNVATLFSLMPSAAPFQPALSSSPLSLTTALSPPALSFSATSLTFASTVVGFSTAVQTITISNTGASTIPIQQILSSGSSDFGVTTNCAAGLVAGANCTVQVVFTPQSVGPKTQTLAFAYGSVVYPQQITMSGAGLAGTAAGPTTLAPTSMSFTQIGIPQTLTLTNNGLTPLSISTISTTSGYSQTNNCGSVLQAQSICNIFVSATTLGVTPYPDGTYKTSGTITVIDDSISGSQSIPLSTTSTMVVNTGASELDFGSWVVGTQNIPTQAFGIGAKPVFCPFTASITGPDASDFSISNAVCSPYTATDTISFSPSAIGPRIATLVTYAGNISLVGTGTAAGPSFVLAAVSSAQMSAPIGTASTPVQYSATNNGSTSLQLQTAVSGANAGEFAVTNTCSAALAPTGSCSLAIVFTPVQAGLQNAVLTVTDSVSGQQQTVAISGNGQFQSPTLTPASLVFGNTQIGALSSPQTISIAVANGDPVHVSPYDTSGVTFPVDSGTCSSGTPCQISVRFSPSAVGSTGESLIVQDLITGSFSVASLSGTGGMPAVMLSSYSLGFAARNIGSISIPQTIVLTNNGNLPLSITGISLIGANFGDYSIQSSNCSGTIAVNGTCSVGISFSPAASGTRSASLQIVSTAATSPDIVSLSGTGN